MRAVNLLPKDAGKPQRSTPHPALLVGVGGGLAVVAGLAIMTMNASSGLTEKQDAVAAAELRLASLPEPPPPPEPVDTALVGEQDSRRRALDGALSTRLRWDALLRRFSLLLPDDVWLTNLAAQAPTSDPTAAAASGLTITGYTYSHDGVARLLSRLAVMPDLDAVQLQHSTLSDAGGRDVVEFAIVAGIKPVAGGA